MNNRKTPIQKNDRITLSFVGTTDDGAQFESSADLGGPCTFVPEDPKVFPPFAKAVIGMQPGETKTITLAPEEAFGPYRQELVHQVPTASLGPGIKPAPGMILGMDIEKNGEKHKVPAQVLKVEEDRVTLDYNHPLAGKNVHYTITIEAVEPAAS